MNKKLLLFVAFMAFTSFFAQKKIDYTIDNIPDYLLIDKDYIVVERNQNVDLKSQNIFRNNQSDLFLILNKKGLNKMDFSVYYDKLTSVRSLELKIYDKGGVLVKTYKSKDFRDHSVADGFSIFTDHRLKNMEVDHNQFPFFIKFDYETEEESTISLPRFIPFENAEENVYKVRFSLIYPEGFNIHRAEQNLEAYKIKSDIEGNKISYSAENLISPVYEELNTRYPDLLPVVHFSNNTFSLGNLKGTANNWNEFGKWYYKNMLEGADELPASTVQKMKELTKNAKSDIEKAKLIFDYVQNNTRYISIQKGIGGWKPFSAKEVDKLGYGDCKALTNYTKALLQAVGVTSYYTVIHASDNIVNIKENVISLQGNHVILTLPTPEGNIYLECTSQRIPFGYLGSSTINRTALAIHPEGTTFVKTQSFEGKTNELKGNFIIDLTNIEKVNSTVSFENKGVFYNSIYGLNTSKREEVYQYIQNILYTLKNFNLVNFDLKNDKETITYYEKYDIESSAIGSRTGNDYLVSVNPYFQLVNEPKHYRSRKTNFYIERDKDFDLTFEYLLPENYILSFAPEPFQIESKFGNYNLDIKLSDNKIIVTEKLTLHSGDFAKEDYGQYRKFMTDVALRDNSKFILTQK